MKLIEKAGFEVVKYVEPSSFSHTAVFNNDDKLFYALDTSYHTNEGWQLVPTSEKFADSIRYLMNRYGIGKQIDTIYIDDRYITVVIIVKSMLDLDLQDLNKLYGLEKIRVDSDSKLLLYFSY